MGPRADFVCNAKRCQQEDGAAPVYELPTTATRCPVCGSKRIKRLFNAVNVSSGLAKHTDAIVQPAYEQAVQARIPTPLVTAVPLRGLNAELGKYGHAANLGGYQGPARPSGQRTLAPILARQGPPKPGSVMRDTEGYRVMVERDKSGKFVDAKCEKG